jgi:hypothetical protein
MEDIAEEADLVFAEHSANELEEEAFLRQWTICEEDRFKFTSDPWRGEFRWFRSPNVVCLERYRSRKAGGVVLRRSGEADSATE